MKINERLLPTGSTQADPVLIDAYRLQQMMVDAVASLDVQDTYPSPDRAEREGARTVDLVWTIKPAEIVGRVTESQAARMMRNRVCGEGPYATLCRTQYTGVWRPLSYAIGADTESATVLCGGGVQSTRTGCEVFSFSPGSTATSSTSEHVYRMVVRFVDVAQQSGIDYASRPILPTPKTMDDVEARVRAALQTYKIIEGLAGVRVSIDMQKILDDRLHVEDVVKNAIATNAGMGGVAIAGAERTGHMMHIEAVPLTMPEFLR